MALLKIALLVLVCLEGCVLTSDFIINSLQNVPDPRTANGDICKDCTQIFELLADLASSADFQKKIMNAFDDVCELLPVGPAKYCKEEVEKILPLAINLITAVMKPEEMCKFIGLCSSSRQEKDEMLQDLVKEFQVFQEAVTSKHVVPSKQCTFCMLIVKTLEDMLPRQKTETEVIDLLEEICYIVPSMYRSWCQSVIGEFTKIVLEAIMSYATPQTVCSLIHVCKEQEAPIQDACTLTAYRCRDVKTAIKCGTLFHCQKFPWKLLK